MVPPPVVVVVVVCDVLLIGVSVFFVSVVVVLVCANANGAIPTQARDTIIFFMVFSVFWLIECELFGARHLHLRLSTMRSYSGRARQGRRSQLATHAHFMHAVRITPK